jgi:hypothetical protein
MAIVKVHAPNGLWEHKTGINITNVTCSSDSVVLIGPGQYDLNVFLF